MVLLGTAVIANWSWKLIRASGAVLLDMQPGDRLAAEIARLLKSGCGDRICDLHLWHLGPGRNTAVVSLVSDRPQPPLAYKARLAAVPGLSHLTIEVHPCPGEHR